MDKEHLFQWDEIEPLCLLRLLLRKFWLIVLAALIGVMIASLVLTLLVTPQYTCSVTFAVASRASGISTYTDINTTSEVAAIYSEILTGRLTKDILTQSLGANVSAQLQASQLGDTNLLKVSAVSESPRNALSVIQTIMDRQETLSQYVSDTAVLSVLNSPSLTASNNQYYDTVKICLIAGAFCAVVMAAALCWLSINSRTVQTRTGAKNNLDAKILSTIPHEGRRVSFKGLFRRQQRQELNITSPLVSFGFTESVHQIAVRLEHENIRGRKVFLFSSVSEAEGKSTVAANTALSLAAKGSRILFVDLDLRRPVQHQILGVTVPREQEFGRLLSSHASASEILDAALILPNTQLFALLSSHSYLDTVERLSSDALAEVIRLARNRFDYVILDTPPLGYFSDSEILSDLSDGSVLVVRQDLVPAPVINDAVDALRAGNSDFLGCVLNDMRHFSAGSSVYGYGYGGRYYGKYSKYGKYGKYGKTTTASKQAKTDA